MYKHKANDKINHQHIKNLLTSNSPCFHLCTRVIINTTQNIHSTIVDKTKVGKLA